MKDFFLPKLFVILPLILFLIMPWVAEQDFRDMKVCIVDNDRSTFSSRLIQKIDANRLFVVKNVVSSYAMANEMSKNSEIDFIVSIPVDFEKTLANGMADLDIAANSCNMMKGGLGSSYLTYITMDVAAELRGENLANTNAPRIMQSNIQTYYMFNSRLDYKVLMTPILLVILLTLVAGFLPALHRFYLPDKLSEMPAKRLCCQYYEWFYLPDKFNDTSAQEKVTSFVVPLIFYYVVGEILFWLGIAISDLYIGIPISVHNFEKLFVWSSLYLLGVTAFSLIIGRICRKPLQAMTIMLTVILCGIIFSGLFTPVNAMPEWAQNVAKYNPVQHLMNVMRMLYLKG